jgi:putative flippase GtrA
MKKIKELFLQLVKFGGVGVVCFIIDFATLHLLTDYAKLHYLVSAAIAFTVSVVVNYLLSVKFVFNVDPELDKKRNFILFVFFSVIGLILTEILMWIGVDKLVFNYMIVKIGATAIVMVFNFITRKLFLEKH